MESKITFRTSSWSWEEIIDYEMVELKDDLNSYLNEIFKRQTKPMKFANVALSTLELKHIRTMRKIIAEIIG